MSHLRALLILLVVSFTLPASARADAGWSMDTPGVQRRAAAAVERVPTIAASPRELPPTLAGFGAGGQALQPPGGNASRETFARVVLEDTPADHASPLHAAHSRYRAARRGCIQYAPALAVATRGIVGCHTSPAPPRA